jgi:Ser/Thr protein kinase RdoA (MazF antagonist)
MHDDGGNSLHNYHDFNFALFTRRGGYPPELDDLDNLFILGRTLGRIHAVGRAGKFSERITISVEQMLTRSSDYLLQYFIPSSLQPAYASLAKDLKEVVSEIYSSVKASDLIRIHGDCHVGNILWRDNSAHFVDLDDCAMAPAVQDIWMFLSGDRHRRQLQLAKVVEGYNEFCDFDPGQLRWIEALRTMRIVHYAAWLGRRWEDPAFPRSFTWFNTERYWGEHILELREQLAALREEPLKLL